MGVGDEIRTLRVRDRSEMPSAAQAQLSVYMYFNPKQARLRFVDLVTTVI